MRAGKRPPAGALRPGRTTLLYDLVALGMRAWSHAVFRVRLLGRERLALVPGTIIASTHERHADVPVICGELYFALGLLRRRRGRPGFVVRDDLFLPGFFAGFLPGLPLLARRLLFPLGVGRIIGSTLSCLPIRSPKRMHLVELLVEAPELDLELLPPEYLEPLRTRARRLGYPPPRRAADVLRGEYADLLWVDADRERASVPELEPLWSRRAIEAAEDFSRFVELLRAGGSLLMFPEGRLSPDGAIGPLQRAVGTLVRRSQAARIQPLGLSYDPLVRGRPLVLVGVGEGLEPPWADVEPRLLAALRLATPLTCGQVVAEALLRDPEATPDKVERGLEQAVASAQAEGRPVDPALAGPERRQRLEEALAAGRRLGGDHEAVRRLARRYESAREAA